jgi:hypothetical protein
MHKGFRNCYFTLYAIKEMKIRQAGHANLMGQINIHFTLQT